MLLKGQERQKEGSFSEFSFSLTVLVLLLDVDGREVGSDVAAASFIRSLYLNGWGYPLVYIYIYIYMQTHAKFRKNLW